MASLTVKQMREIEQRAIRSGTVEGELMMRAGVALGRAIGNQYRSVWKAVAYVGKGHNAGDALVALWVLKEEFGWDVGVRSCYKVSDFAKLTASQWKMLGLEGFLEKGYEKKNAGSLIILDGLLGIGAEGGLREPLLEMAHEMERLRSQCAAVVVAVDNPSGVDPDHGEVFPGAVLADLTLMIGAEKSGLLLSKAANFTGQLGLVPVEDLENSGSSGMELICPQNMDFGKAPRPFDFHKGMAGRVGIVAGSENFSGAALLAALGAIRTGAGLVTLWVRPEIAESVRVRLPYEVMLKVSENPMDLIDEKLDAIVVGPGLGEMGEGFSNGLAGLIENSRVPMVIDADALNFMSQRGLKPKANHVLTPHPGEFARLEGDLVKLEREDAARAFVEKNDGVLLFKGARTLVAKRGFPLRVNGTGTPAMSNGGQGDLLSGVIGALLAGGMNGFDAAAYGAWLCGHAAELSQAEIGDVCTAGDTGGKLSEAMRNWRRGGR